MVSLFFSSNFLFEDDEIREHFTKLGVGLDCPVICYDNENGI